MGMTESSLNTNDYYQKCIRQIIFEDFDPHFAPSEATQLLDYLYIGNHDNACDLRTLKKLGITHVLNMAAHITSLDVTYPPESGVIGYKPICAMDNERYYILQHFQEASNFIKKAKASHGKVLVHCNMGINRSGAICIAFLMVDQKIDLLTLLRMVKDKRKTILYNSGFQRQLIGFARANNLLKRNNNSLK